MSVPMACLGIDVSKSKLDGVVDFRARAGTRALHKIVPNTRAGAEELLDWAIQCARCEFGELLVVLEVTSAYHLVAAHAAHERGCPVGIANPHRSRPFARALGHFTKNDRVDAAMLARFGLQMPIRRWQPVPGAVRELYALLCRRQKLADRVRREEAALEPLVLKCVPAVVCTSIEESIRFHLEASQRFDEAIEDLFAREPALNRDRSLLLSIPGIGFESACHLVCLLRGRKFAKAREPAALCGLVPIHHHTGTNAASGGHVSKTSHKRIRVVLHMPALNLSRNDPRMKAVYERLIAQGKHHHEALIAIKRRMVHIAFGVLKHQKPYAPEWVSLSAEARLALADTVSTKPCKTSLERRRRKLYRELGLIAGRKPWTEAERALLREHAGKYSLADICCLLGRTRPAVRRQLQRDGLPPPGRERKSTSNDPGAAAGAAHSGLQP